MIESLVLLRCSTMEWFVVPLLAHFAWGAAELLGYVGPGAGLSMLGALFAVACVVLLALLGPILYPLYLLRVWLRRRRARIASLASADAGDMVAAPKAEVFTASERCVAEPLDECFEPEGSHYVATFPPGVREAHGSMTHES